MNDGKSLTEMLRARAELEDRIREHEKRYARTKAECTARAAEEYARVCKPAIEAAMAPLDPVAEEGKPLAAEAVALDDRIGPVLEDGKVVLFFRAGEEGPYAAYLDADGDLAIAPASWSSSLPLPDPAPERAPAGPDVESERGPDGVLRVIADGVRDALKARGFEPVDVDARGWAAAVSGCRCPKCRAARGEVREADASPPAAEPADVEESVVAIDAEVS
ncbi:hypothetical protein [Paludisphaera soli]|uniref:hypothetical protein n=1 Tax=Paludisphaera soli TaxID=2712865 RepID=UPI0013ED4222|nr:hypothetical protein [Paludisphaera soli]